MYNDKLSKSIAEAAKKVMDEELKGNQHKIDVNKNNKIDAEDFKHLRAGKKPVAEASKADVPAYLRKQKGEAPLTVADVKAPRKDSISAKENLAKLRNEEQEQIQEYQSVGGKYVHIAKPAKDAEAGTTDWDKEEKMAKDLTSKSKTKKPRKLGARQNFVRSTRVNEGFSAMLDTYEESGIQGLFESWAKKKVMKEEPTNDEYKAELEKQKAKAAGTAPQADVAKSAVQAVQQEEVEQLDELSPGTLKSYIKGAKASKHLEADAVRVAQYKDNHAWASDATQVMNKRKEGIKTAKAKLNAEEVEQVEERTLTEPETKKKEEIVKSMKKGIEGFKERYGDRAKEVMYATATKQAKLKEETESEHYKAGHEYASDHAQDSGFKVTARARKKEMLADNPHKKGTPEHDDWHRGALDGHQTALDNM